MPITFTRWFPLLQLACRDGTAGGTTRPARKTSSRYHRIAHRLAADSLIADK